MGINIQYTLFISHLLTCACSHTLMSCQAQWLERLAELDLQIIYRPGVQNTSADILSRYGQSIEGGNAVVAQNSLGDMRTAQLVQTWLSVVAPHVDFQHCYEAA